MNSLKLYSVYDEQFRYFSDPFCSFDDNAAERLMTQTALVSSDFRKRLCFQSLHCIGSFDPASKTPFSALKRPRLVSCPERLIDLVDAIDRAQKAHRATVSAPPDSYLFEKANDKIDCDSFLVKHCSDDFPDLVEKEVTTCE